MTFSKKLSALLALTMTKNSDLARAIHIDQSQISRMKTGAREQPRKPQLCRLMADYFAKCYTIETLINSNTYFFLAKEHTTTE